MVVIALSSPRVHIKSNKKFPFSVMKDYRIKKLCKIRMNSCD